MKKIIAVAAILALAAVMLAACGGSGVVGKWEGNMMGAATITLEFKSDNTYTMTMKSSVAELGSESHNGTYKVDGNKITIDGTESEFKIDGNKLTVQIPEIGGQLEFTRK